MFITALIGLLTLAAIVAFGIAIFGKNPMIAGTYSREPEEYPLKRISLLSGVGLLVLTFIVSALSMVTIVGATEVGVPVAFGRVYAPLESGVHVVAPWQKVETYPIRPVTVELSGENRVLARTADAGQMSVEIAARWKVDPVRAKDLYMQVRTGNDDRISEDIVVKNLRQAVGQVYSMTSNLDAINDRDKTTLQILDQLNVQLKAYGILIEDVNLRSVEPDAKTAATIATYASQQQATRIAEEAKKTAAIEAERRVIEAAGLEKSAKALARMTPAQIQVLCMQVWQQVMTKAIDEGVSVYTSPCGSTTSVIAK